MAMDVQVGVRGMLPQIKESELKKVILAMEPLFPSQQVPKSLWEKLTLTYGSFGHFCALRQ